MTPNWHAFLDAIAISEGTSTSKITQDNGYDILVSGIDGPARFDSYATHPNILVTVNHQGLKSTAAGRYQILYKNWLYYMHLLGLSNFGPGPQDAIAMQMIRETRADADINSGHIADAVNKVSHLWASLPGANYNQHENTLAEFLGWYKSGGGTLA